MKKQQKQNTRKNCLRLNTYTSTMLIVLSPSRRSSCPDTNTNNATHHAPLARACAKKISPQLTAAVDAHSACLAAEPLVPHLSRDGDRDTDTDPRRGKRHNCRQRGRFICRERRTSEHQARTKQADGLTPFHATARALSPRASAAFRRGVSFVRQ